MNVIGQILHARWKPGGIRLQAAFLIPLSGKPAIIDAYHRVPRFCKAVFHESVGHAPATEITINMYKAPLLPLPLPFNPILSTP